MEITGSQSIGAPRQQVWDALNDPAILKQCLPGCESVERVSPEEFRVIMAAAIGPLRARFNGNLRMTQSKPPESCLMVFEGQGGVVGFGKGSSSVSLAETPEGTTLSYTANAQVGGKLAQVGSRLIDNVARKMADDFFAALRRQLVPVAPSAKTIADKPAISPTTQPDLPRPQAAAVHAPPVAPVAVEAAAPPNHSALHGQPAPAAPAAPVAMVPAWWLAIAMALGAVASLAGAIVAR
jgi:carbon monoxide dehydrogenase subunit G